MASKKKKAAAAAGGAAAPRKAAKDNPYVQEIVENDDLRDNIAAGLRVRAGRVRPPQLVQEAGARRSSTTRSCRSDLKKAADVDPRRRRDAHGRARQGDQEASGGGLGRKLLLVLVAGGPRARALRGSAQEGPRRAVRRRGGVRVHLDLTARGASGGVTHPRASRQPRPGIGHAPSRAPFVHSAMKSRTVTSAARALGRVRAGAAAQAPGGTSSRAARHAGSGRIDRRPRRSPPGWTSKCRCGGVGSASPVLPMKPSTSPASHARARCARGRERSTGARRRTRRRCRSRATGGCRRSSSVPTLVSRPSRDRDDGRAERRRRCRRPRGCRSARRARRRRCPS